MFIFGILDVAQTKALYVFRYIYIDITISMYVDVHICRYSMREINMNGEEVSTQKERIETLLDKQKEADLQMQKLEDEEEAIRQNLEPFITPIAKRTALAVVNKRDDIMTGFFTKYVSDEIKSVKEEIRKELKEEMRKELIKEIHDHTGIKYNCPHCIKKIK